MEPKYPSKRSLFGKICKNSFIIFNIIILAWTLYYSTSIFIKYDNGSYSANGELDPTLSFGIGVVIISTGIIWVLGNVFLGLLTLLTKPR